MGRGNGVLPFVPLPNLRLPAYGQSGGERAGNEVDRDMKKLKVPMK